MTTSPFAFASDNTAGMCPEALSAIQACNDGFHPSYGDDPITAEAAEAFRELFETNCDVYFVFTGTAANSLALASLCQSYHSVITHESAHIETDECGAPEFFSNGTKLLTTPGALGKLDPREIEKAVTRRRDIHYPKPRVISLSCPTELGTVYTPEELKNIGSVAKQYGLKVHMDGARFSHAVASLNIEPRALTWEAGVDVLSFGGTKLGMAFGEAVVFFDRALGEEFSYRCKQAGQLASKMRFLAAPWIPLLKNNVWKEMAGRANALAKQLANGIQTLPGARILYPTEANAVFAELPEEVHTRIKAKGWRYYVFIGGGARFMCSWRTTERDVEALLADLRA
ncbi:MAG: low specificity L-threonine aldolase [Verrucomicrobiota bacterium]